MKDAVRNLLSRDEVFPRSNLSLSLAGTTLDLLSELQCVKGFRPGVVLRLVEGIDILCNSDFESIAMVESFEH